MDFSIKKFKKWLSLIAFTLVFVVGELSHFILGTVTTPMSQELHYGEKECMVNPSLDAEDYYVDCYLETNETYCATLGTPVNSTLSTCVWDYSGFGLEYQLLAGPAFIAVFTISGVIISMISDRHSRRLVVLIALGFLTSATIITGAAKSLWQLFLLRMMIGASESAFQPACSSMISDTFEKERHGLALGIFYWGIYLGYGLAYIIGNFVTSANLMNLGWRASYIIGGLIGLLPFILLLCFVEEPQRGKTEDLAQREIKDNSPEKKTFSDIWKPIFYGELSLIRVLKEFLKPSSIIIVIAACIRHSAGFTWAYNTQLYFSHYYPSYNLGIWIPIASIVGGTIGVAIGGFVSDKLVSKIGIKGRLYVLSGSQMMAFPFAIGVLYFSPPGAFVSLTVAYFFAEMWFGVLMAILLDIFPSCIHSTGIAVALFIINNVGGNAPVLIYHLRKVLSYRTSLLLMYPCNYLLSSLLFFLASFLLRKEKLINSKDVYGSM